MLTINMLTNFITRKNSGSKILALGKNFVEHFSTRKKFRGAF